MTENHRVFSTLIVDDDPADVYLTKMQLKQSGRFEHVLVAETGEQAIELYRDYEGSRAKYPGKFPPLVILLDINMPKMNGFEFLEAYEELRPNIPQDANAAVFLMLTSSGRETDRKRAEDFTVVRGYLTKPFTVEDALGIADQFGTRTSD